MNRAYMSNADEKLHMDFLDYQLAVLAMFPLAPEGTTEKAWANMHPYPALELRAEAVRLERV